MTEFIVICGPTASGKSTTGVLLAEALDGEIISADSMQVYRGLDIGTDKASPELQARIPHHMLDVVDPGEAYSVARYEREAGSIIDRLIANDTLPIVVGGSGLYIRILINGIFPSPPASSAIRERLKKEADQQGVHALHERLLAVDPDYARIAARGDLRRIVRALEVFELTGSPFSSWHKRHKADRKPRNAFMIGLLRAREDLNARIERRVDWMIDNGLVKEVRHLCESGHGRALQHLRPLGYKEILDYLEGQTDLEEAVRLIKRNSRRFAKRQMTWFRKEEVTWIELNAADDASEAVKKIMAVLPADLSF